MLLCVPCNCRTCGNWLASVREQQQHQQVDGALGAAPVVVGPTHAGEEGLPLGGAAAGREARPVAGVAALAVQRREELLRVAGRIVGQVQGQER